MGEVYRARDPVLKREVAIKVLPPFLSHDSDRLSRFHKEAEAAAALNDPNILAIHQFGIFNGAPYLVSELLEGSTLRQLLERGALPVRKAIDFGVQIAHGLAAAHDEGIVHRDLKPENLFVTKHGHVKILDFGLAKLMHREPDLEGTSPTLTHSTEPGVVMGTVGYMAPEQVLGKAADHRVDIFAFGAILYEMVAAKRAFQRPSSPETMTAILNDDTPDISQIAPNVPPGLQRVVHRCLEKNPEQRFQSASDLAFALEAISDLTGASTPIGQSSAASSKRWAWIVVAGGALAAIVLALYTWRRSAASPTVHAITQLTNDAVPKSAYLKLATDGTRVYFNEGEFGSTRVSEVAAGGGPTAALPISLPSPQVAGLSPNGSSLLVTAEGLDKGEGRDAAIAHQSLWTVPLPAGEPRRLGDISAAEATYLQNGRILFAKGLDLYTADADGSNSHKLLGVGADFAEITEIAASPDGSRIVFLAQKNREWTDMQLMVIATNGTGLHTVARNRTATEPICCVNWSRDGRFVVYAIRNQTIWNLWACPDGSSFLRHSGSPVQLTAGPLSYTQPIPSRDGNQILAIGTQYRGELVRYDAQSKQFVPILSGISAWGPTFSANGSWVTYTSFPDQTLWRSRADGSERKQLTFPPMMVSFPFISPDGKRVAFGTREGDLYLINTDGSQLQKFGGRVSLAPNWSPDGTQLVFTLVTAESRELRLFNVQTGEISASPQLAGFGGGQWVGANEFVAFSTKDLTMKIYNLKTQAWSDLLSGTIVNWAHSPDWKYLYYTTGGSDPQAMRIRLSDHKIETITSLKGIRRALDPSGKTQMGVAPDGSPVFTRDIGTQEVYSLTMK